MAETLTLVLISGPVASGKTTLAWNAATFARATGEVAAAVDMDELTEMVGGSDWTQIRGRHRQQACGLAAALIDRMSAQGVRLVAIAGSTLSPVEWTTVLERATVPIQPITVRLQVSVAGAIRRAQSDPTRVLTRDPEVVRRLHRAIDWDAAAPPDLEIETDELTANEVTALLMAHVRDEDRDPLATSTGH